MRSISIIAGVASVGLMYVLGRISFGRRGGLFAAALLAVWSAHVDYSQEARAYSFFFLLTLLSSVGLALYGEALRGERGLQGGANSGRRSFALLLFGAGNVLSFYTHLISVFWIALTSLLLIAVVVRERRAHLPELLTVFVLMALCAAPGLYRFAVQHHIGADFTWLRQYPFDQFLITNADLFLPLGLLDNPTTKGWAIQHWARAITVVMSLTTLASALWLARESLTIQLRERPAIVGLIIAYLALPPVIWLFGFLAKPIFMTRTILFCLPGFILLVVGLILSVGRMGGIAGIGLLVLLGASTFLGGTIRQKDDWRGAYLYLASAASAEDLIALCNPASFPALRYATNSPVSAGALVLAANDRLLEVETKLGTNPNWDDAFFLQNPSSGARTSPRLQPWLQPWPN